ncbi:SDR family oxidoreductase [Aliiglaciecola sp. 3_MG-2023]|uniref:SDR family oxidoreductase n=1 Tax=Aliiglaciecola sp. 3_MG-2023 TaxID=3062644 RepID=UPI0026E29359|nr:SDR family oxidoreductase [Aliiglaciecola sp. 3_MG-2023]MDO6692685.1 SDR family oxidoreductase [Aliiglaciecola sp. 3_MG-2023]
MNKIAIITGASTGLGASISILLAEKGYKVYATMRNLEKQSTLIEAAEKAGVSLEVKQLDVQDASSVERCFSYIIEREGRIDILINNAGAGFVRTTEQASESEIQWVMDVNFMGVVRCTKAVMPHMRKQRSGHVINISSVGGLVGQPFNEIYCAAKFAVEGYTESMASYIQPSFNINFTIVEPGGISSEFANSALKQFQSTGGMKDDEYRPILEKYIGGAQSRSDGVYQTSDQVAEVVIECIQNPTPPVRIRTSTWAEEFCSLKTQADPTGKLLQERVIKTLL